MMVNLESLDIRGKASLRSSMRACYITCIYIIIALTVNICTLCLHQWDSPDDIHGKVSLQYFMRACYITCINIIVSLTVNICRPYLHQWDSPDDIHGKASLRSSQHLPQLEISGRIYKKYIHFSIDQISKINLSILMG